MTAKCRLAVMICIIAGAACDDSPSALPTGPEPPVPPPPTTLLRITALGGADQRGLAGERLPAAIVVDVRDDAGQAVAGVRVTFTPSNGSVSPASGITDSAGRAATEWTLAWAPGRQTLRANVDSGGVSGALTINADAQVNPAADLIVARGALGRTVYLMFVAEAGVRQLLHLAAGDSVVYMAPDSDLSDQWIAAFSIGRFPAVLRPRSSTGTDTMSLSLAPPFSVPLTVWLADSAQAVRTAAERDLATTDAFWRSSPWGLQLGDVRIHASNQPGEPISCPNAPPGDTGRINIFYSTNAQIGGFGGFSCSPRTIIMRQLAGAPYLLAHEIGHSFGLGHPPQQITGNFMHPSAAQSGILLWQIHTAHFSGFSALNSVYGLRTATELGACCIVPIW